MLLPVDRNEGGTRGMHPANARRIVGAAGVALPFVLYATTSVGVSATGTPQTTTPLKIKLIEWDLSEQMDNTPGAMAVDVQGDGNRIWFSTRVQMGDAPRLYQF